MSLGNNSSVKKPSSASGTTESPYLGSKISLVSKAKIRYEGILYTIDANESTVALSKVRSFGTEGRPTDRPVPPRDEIFEYIIFRGADIEDLQVREPPQNTLTQDPAIVESSMYPTSARSTSSGANNNNNNNLGGSQTRSTLNQGNMSSASVQQSNVNKGLKSTSNADPLRQLNLNQQQQQQQTSRPFGQQATSGQLDGQDYSYGNQRRGRQQQDYSNDYGTNSNNNRRGNQNYGYAEWPRTNNSAWDNGYRQQPQRYNRQQQQQQQQNYEGNRYPARRPNTGQQSNGYHGYRERRNSTGGITGNQQRNNRQQRERAESIRGNSNNQSSLKFIGDFDFEKSNATFDKNAIEDEIKKSLSIKPTKEKTDETKTTENENNQEEKPHPEQQQPEQQEPQEAQSLKSDQQEANPEGYYDKQKSFFDRISCETTEKEKTTTNSRRNWNEERRINAETFGLKYRPAQGGNQRNAQGGGGYHNYNRRYNGGQQSYYGNNGGRYQRGGGGGGNYGGHQQRGGGGGGGNGGGGRNTTYYGNTNRRMQAY